MRLKNSQVLSDLTIASLVATSTALCSNMANREHQHPHPHPPRTSSRWPAPGIHVNLEFGVSFSNNDSPHTASMKYTSRNMQERMYNQQQESFYRQQNPQSLMPGNIQERQSRPQQRSRSLEVRPSYPYERGSSAPPTLQPISPVSPITPLLHHTGSMPLEGADRPLPAAPSRFRLGEDGLPWSTEPFYRGEEREFASPTRPAMVGIELEERRTEDPQRVREL